jgi:hypothetical protein
MGKRRRRAGPIPPSRERKRAVTLACVDDTPRWLRTNAKLVSYVCISLQLVTLVLQFVDISDDESPWIPLALMYLAAAVLGVDAIARGVRKRAGVGPSIANLAPGGWTIFAAMFWIVAVPAYYVGARRRVGADDDPRERVTWGSWLAIGTFAAIGGVLLVVGIAK